MAITLKDKPVKIENGHYEYRGFVIKKVHHSGSGYWIYIYQDDKLVTYTSPSADYRPSLRKDGFQEIDYKLRKK